MNDRHFFAASAFTWRVDVSLEKLINRMKAEKHPFNLWLVPVDVELDYDIENYKPQIEGATWLTTINPKTK